jgi:hypothetical protein
VSPNWLLDESPWLQFTSGFDPHRASISSPFGQVPVLQQLIATTGSQASPLRDLTIKGVSFRDAAAVYEEQWEVPSGGGVFHSPHGHHHLGFIFARTCFVIPDINLVATPHHI